MIKIWFYSSLSLEFHWDWSYVAMKCKLLDYLIYNWAKRAGAGLQRTAVCCVTLCYIVADGTYLAFLLKKSAESTLESANLCLSFLLFPQLINWSNTHEKDYLIIQVINWTFLHFQSFQLTSWNVSFFTVFTVIPVPYYHGQQQPPWLKKHKHKSATWRKCKSSQYISDRQMICNMWYMWFTQIHWLQQWSWFVQSFGFLLLVWCCTIHFAQN